MKKKTIKKDIELIYFSEYLITYPELTKIINPGYIPSFYMNKNYIDSMDIILIIQKFYVILWLIKKKLDPKFKIKFSSIQGKFMKDFEDIGEIYYRLYNCCETLHSITSIKNNNYKNALEWWVKILKEGAITGVNQGSKSTTIKYLQKFNSKLKKFERDDESKFINPVDKKFIHLWRLIELLFEMSEKFNNIHKDYLIPLNNSLSAYTENYRKKEQLYLGVDENGRCYIPSGSGKGRIYLDEKVFYDEYKNLI